MKKRCGDYDQDSKIETILYNNDCSIFFELLYKYKYLDQLNNYTLFAPTNNALLNTFKATDEKILNEILDGMNKESIILIIDSHIYSGKLTLKNIKCLHKRNYCFKMKDNITIVDIKKNTDTITLVKVYGNMRYGADINNSFYVEENNLNIHIILGFID